MAGRRIAAWCALGVLCGLPFASVAPVGASRNAGYQNVASLRGTYVIQPDGTVQASETITARFTGNDGHGIYRTITNRQKYDPRPKTERVYEISNIRVSADPGIPTDTSTSQSGADLVIRIGDAARTIGPGLHTYNVSYTISGALNHFDDHDEFYWNVTGNKWNRIDEVEVTERGPAPFTRVACYAGPSGSKTPCATSTLEPDGSASFADGPLTYAGLTTVVALPTGVISPVPEPILEAEPSTSSVPLFILLGVSALELIALCGAIIAFVVVRGRDRQSVGSAVDQAFADTDGGDGERVPVMGGQEIPVQFEPPDKLRPGLIGILVEEEASTLDVTATIIDLACRGYLRIVEVEPTGLIFKHADWRIDRMRPDVDGLESYEVTLINALFPGAANSVVLSELQNSFASSMKDIKKALTTGAMQRRWFRRDPGKSAQGAKTLAGVMIVLGLVGTFTCVLAFFAVPLVIAGILLFFLARYLPARTPVGTATYRRALGFRRFITESEKYRAQYAERANLFTEYLPYAIVFGAATRWAKTFKDLGLVPAETPAWYYSPHGFDAVAFSAALTSFTTTSSSTLTSTPGGSGSSGFGGGGFSGGGGGGGGGGGW